MTTVEPQQMECQQEAQGLLQVYLTFLPQDLKILWILALTLKVQLCGCENQVKNLCGNR